MRQISEIIKYVPMFVFCIIVSMVFAVLIIKGINRFSKLVEWILQKHKFLRKLLKFIFRAGIIAYLIILPIIIFSVKKYQFILLLVSIWICFIYFAIAYILGNYKLKLKGKINYADGCLSDNVKRENAINNRKISIIDMIVWLCSLTFPIILLSILFISIFGFINNELLSSILTILISIVFIFDNWDNEYETGEKYFSRDKFKEYYFKFLDYSKEIRELNEKRTVTIYPSGYEKYK